MEQKSRGRARVKIAVFLVLAIHGIGLMALLMQGCGQSKEPAAQTETTASNQPPAFVDTTNPPVATSNSPVVVASPAVETPAAPAVPAGATEYTIVKGDILDSIAKKFHVSLKAITNANPGIQPTKLQIGQKIHIPSPAATVTPTAAAVAPLESTTPSGEQIYTVKSGDNLTKIAAQFGTTYKVLKAANGLNTDSIKVGQKLKIPAKASAPATAPATPPEPAPTTTTAPTPTTPTGR